MLDEAGFDALVGAEESLVPARIYAEKALCLSKAFIAHALTKDCGALTDVAEWIYRDPNGPQLLKDVVAGSKALLERRAATQSTGRVISKEPLSAGAKALLRRHLSILESIADSVP